MAAKHRAVVTLSPVNYPDTVSRRVLKFDSAYDTIDVGRSSKTEGRQLDPDTDNAWFSSRVISRTHAKIWTNSDKKEIYVKDLGSMHGTYLGGVRIPPNITHTLENGDVVRFGSEVTRGAGTLPCERDEALKILGNPMSWLPMWSDENYSSCLSNRELPETFPPLDMRVTYEWKETQDTSEQHAPSSPVSISLGTRARVYSVPDDYDSEDDLYEQDEPVQARSEKDPVSRRGFSVPDSDISSVGSFEHEDEHIMDSPTSSTSKLMQSTLDLINKPLQVKPQAEDAMQAPRLAPSKFVELHHGPSGLTEQEKKEDERAFRALGLRESEKVLIVLDGEGDGSQKNPIPVDYDTIEIQEEPFQDKLGEHDMEISEAEPEFEEYDSHSPNSSLFDASDVDEGEMDEELYSLAHDIDEELESAYAESEVNPAESEVEGLADDPSEVSIEDETSWPPATSTHACETDEEVSELGTWEEREQSAAGPSPQLTYPGPMCGTSTTHAHGSPPAPPSRRFAASYVPMGVFPSSVASHGHPLATVGRAPSPSDAAMAKPTPSEQAAPQFNNGSAFSRWYAGPHSNYPTPNPYAGFTSPMQWNPSGGASAAEHAYPTYESGRVYEQGPFALSYKQRLPTMGSHVPHIPNPLRSDSYRPVIDMNEPKVRPGEVQLNQAPLSHDRPAPSVSLGSKDNAPVPSGRPKTSLDRIRLLQDLREKARAANKKAMDSLKDLTPLPAMAHVSTIEAEPKVSLPCDALPSTTSQPNVPTTKVSIEDIVDKEGTVPENLLSLNRLKRKADTMSTSDGQENAEKTMNPPSTSADDYTWHPPTLHKDSISVEQAQHQMAAHQLADLKNSSASKSSEITDGQVSSTTTMESDEQSEPAAKRIKTTGHSGSSSFAKYAATAVGGVILGGIGAVAALIALPPDYFV